MINLKALNVLSVFSLIGIQTVGVSTAEDVHQQSRINAFQGMQSEVSTGQLEIVGDRNEYTKDGAYFIATGNVYVAIVGQDSRLTADKVVYNLSKQILDAAGNVRIEREGSLFTGSRFKFWVAHPGYLITNTTTKVIDLDGKLIRERVAIKSADSNAAGDSYVFYSSKRNQDGRIDQFLHGKGNSIEGDFNQPTAEQL